MKKFRTLTLSATAVAATVTLAGCASGGMGGMDMGSGSGAGSTPNSAPSAAATTAAQFNEADVAFAQNMIVHHTNAIEMADVLLAKDGIDQRVVDLANQIKAAQAPEIEQLRTWLGEWGAQEMGAMPGMAMDMTELENATGVEAARIFLEQMKVHHQGAISMAQTQIETGSNPDAIAMAENIVTTQTEEIGTIDSILASL